MVSEQLVLVESVSWYLSRVAPKLGKLTSLLFESTGLGVLPPSQRVDEIIPRLSENNNTQNHALDSRQYSR